MSNLVLVSKKCFRRYGWVGAVATVLASAVMICYDRFYSKITSVSLREILGTPTVYFIPVATTTIEPTTSLLTTTVYFPSTITYTLSVTSASDTIHTPAPLHPPTAYYTVTVTEAATVDDFITVMVTSTAYYTTTVTETATAHYTMTVTETSAVHNTMTVTEGSTVHDTITITEASMIDESITLIETSTAYDTSTVTETSTAHDTMTIIDTYTAHDTLTITHSPHSDTCPTKIITITPECEPTAPAWVYRELEALEHMLSTCGGRFSRGIRTNGRDDPSVEAMIRECEAHHREWCYLSKRLNINWATCAIKEDNL